MAPRQAAQPGGLKAAATVITVQTYSFLGEQSIPGKRVLGAYQRRFGIGGPEEIAAPVGVANAFDAVHLLARALRQVDDPASGDAVRQALETLQTPYEGLIKAYQQPFSADSHEALSVDDYMVVVWRDGQPAVERAATR
jgi:branched-chain amino acid transport system substrate-binding protein